MGKIAWMDPKKIHTITIHCAATPEGRAHSAAEITKWDEAKFGQPSYHHVIELDGSHHRTLRDDQRGAHTGGHNTGNIGICYVGGVAKDGKTPKDTRRPAQCAAMLTLIRTYRARFPDVRVIGHRDWPGVSKACPSFDVRSWLSSFGL